MTAINAINAFGEKGIASQEIIIDQVDNKNTNESDTEKRLIELQNLYDKNLISQQEYEQRRKEIIDSI